MFHGVVLSSFARCTMERRARAKSFPCPARLPDRCEGALFRIQRV
jgi:hypothetical protein